jgi:hypothetical protein
VKFDYEKGVGARSNPHVVGELEAHPKPCCARIAHGVWCQRVDGHTGECSSEVAPTYGPIEAKPPLWRTHKGQSIACGKPLAELGTWCAFQKGHGGPCAK